MRHTIFSNDTLTAIDDDGVVVAYYANNIMYRRFINGWYACKEEMSKVTADMLRAITYNDFLALIEKVKNKDWDFISQDPVQTKKMYEFPLHNLKVIQYPFGIVDFVFRSDLATGNAVKITLYRDKTIEMIVPNTKIKAKGKPLQDIKIITGVDSSYTIKRELYEIIDDVCNLLNIDVPDNTEIFITSQGD